MLDVSLRVLSFLGIILLTLILLLLAALLLVLFFPVTYRIRGRRTAEKMELSAGMNWLFGLLRVRCSYPEPGALTAKLLWFQLYHTKLPPEDKDKVAGAEPKPGTGEKISGGPAGGQKQAAQGQDGEAQGQGGAPPEETQGQGETQPEEAPGQDGAQPEEAQGQGGAQGQDGAQPEEAQGQGGTQPEEAQGQEETGAEEPRGGFFEKFKKIKYTISSIYDKIKEIWKNISYYTALLQEEDTRQLWAYGKLRAAKVLKNIRPRHIRADILFGTGAPDTTGYVFGMYCMFYPVLGTEVLVTPDFERAVLEGRLDISGHITVFVLVVNVVRLMMDKKLQAFIRKMKKEASHHKRASQKDEASR